MINKRGQSGSSILTIYRILIVSFIALVVLGISSTFYSYKINVRDSESIIFARGIVDCIAPNGVLNLDSLSENKNNIFSFCGFEDSETGRFFLSVIISDETGEIEKLGDGDDGLEWVHKIYSSDLKTESIKVYEPGYYNGDFSIGLLKNGVRSDAQMKVEVIVKGEI